MNWIPINEYPPYIKSEFVDDLPPEPPGPEVPFEVWHVKRAGVDYMKAVRSLCGEST